MKKPFITQQAADDIISSVTEMLKSEVLKADPGQEAPGEKTPEGSSSAPPAPEGSSPPSDSPPSGDDGAGAPPDPSQPDQASPEALQAEFEAMDPEEFEMWASVVDAVRASRASAGAPDDGSGAPPDAPPPADDASAGGPPPAMKREMPANPGNGGMTKSEAAALQQQVESLSKAVALLPELKALVATRNSEVAALTEKLNKAESEFGRATDAMTAAVTREQVRGKAVTSTRTIGKPGENLVKTESDKPDPHAMSRDQVLAHLAPLAKSEKTPKKDREAILAYTVNPAADVASVARLIVS